MTRLENTKNINTGHDTDNEINNTDNMTPYFKNILEGMAFEPYNHKVATNTNTNTNTNTATPSQFNSFIEIFDRNDKNIYADLDAHVHNGNDQAQNHHHLEGIDVMDYGKTTRTNTLIDDPARMEDYEHDELSVMQGIDGVSQKTVWANFQTGRTMLSYSQPLKFQDHQMYPPQNYHPVKGKLNQSFSNTYNNINQQWSNYMNSPQTNSTLLGQQPMQQVHPGMAHLQHRFSHPSISSGSTAHTYYYPQSSEVDLQKGPENKSSLNNHFGYTDEWDTHTNNSDYHLAQCFQANSTRSSTSNPKDYNQAGETQSVSLVSSHSGSDNSRELLVSTTDLCIFDTKSCAKTQLQPQPQPQPQFEEPVSAKPSQFQYVTFSSPNHHSTKKNSSKYRKGDLSAISQHVKMITMPSVHIGQDVLMTPVLNTPPNSAHLAQTASSMLHTTMGDASVSASGVWSKDVCDAFFQSLAIIPKDDSSRIKLNKKMYGRNELISMYIEYKTYKKRQVKQVSSHLQVTKRRILKKLELMCGNKIKNNSITTLNTSTSSSPSPKTMGSTNTIFRSPTSGRSSSLSSMGSPLDGISKDYMNVIKNINSSGNNAYNKRENHARAVHLKTLKLIDKGIEKTEKNMIFFRKIFEPIARELELRHEGHDSRDNTLIHHPLEVEFEHTL